MICKKIHIDRGGDASNIAGMKRHVLIALACVPWFFLPAFSQTVIATIPVGRTPAQLTADAHTNRVYVANGLDGTVSVIDGAENSVVATVPLPKGTAAEGIAVNPVTGLVYAIGLLSSGSTLSVIDESTNQVTTSIAVGSEPEQVAVNPTTNRVYVTNRGDNTVSVIDGATNAVIDTIPNIPAPTAVAVNKQTNLVYVTNNPNLQPSGFTVIDGATDVVTDTVSLTGYTTGTPLLTGAAVDHTNNRIYLTDNTDSVLFVIAGKTSSVLRVLSGFNGPNYVTVSPGTGFAIVGSSRDNDVITVDTNARTIHHVTKVGRSPAGVAINPNTQRIYAANFDDNTVSVISLP